MCDQVSKLHDLRPPDWRFQLAEGVVRGKLPELNPGRDDPTVARAVRALRGDLTEEAVLAAMQLHNGPALQWAELEARIVADQPNADIAADMGLPSDVTAMYEALFFDVRGRAHSCPGLVLPDTSLPIPRHDVWALLMLAALTRSPVEIGWVALYFRMGLDGGGRINTVRGLSAFEKECAKQTRDWMRRKTLSKNPITTIRSLIAVQKAERRAEARIRREQARPDPPSPTA